MGSRRRLTPGEFIQELIDKGIIRPEEVRTYPIDDERTKLVARVVGEYCAKIEIAHRNAAHSTLKLGGRKEGYRKLYLLEEETNQESYLRDVA